MNLLLCAATPFEIAPAVNFIEQKNLPVDVLITGVGLTATAYALTRAIYRKRPHLLLQAGVAGSLLPALPLGYVVAVENEYIGDLGAEEKSGFVTPFDLGLTDPDQHPWQKGSLKNNAAILKQTGLPLVDAVSVNEISTSPARIERYRLVLGAGIESMEGAALHLVGLSENIPFLQIRSLSNFAGERDKSRWEMKTAIARLNETLEVLIEKLMKP